MVARPASNARMHQPRPLTGTRGPALVCPLASTSPCTQNASGPGDKRVSGHVQNPAMCRCRGESGERRGHRAYPSQRPCWPPLGQCVQKHCGWRGAEGTLGLCPSPRLSPAMPGLPLHTAPRPPAHTMHHHHHTTHAKVLSVHSRWLQCRSVLPKLAIHSSPSSQLPPHMLSQPCPRPPSPVPPPPSQWPPGACPRPASPAPPPPSQWPPGAQLYLLQGTSHHAAAWPLPRRSPGRCLGRRTHCFPAASERAWARESELRGPL